MKILEAVPNFSLGKKTKDFYSLKKVLSGRGVWLLDYSRDVDHNRTVATLVGKPQALQRVILKAVEKVIKLIDIRKHKGVHPFVGSVDVLPFVPIENAKMSDCVKLAKETGRKIAEKFKIPVYLYGKAADGRGRELAEIRKGGLKELEKTISTPARPPDFGPSHLHPKAGALIIGARDFLIAFNVNFASRNLSKVKKIAQKIREKDGGLAGVKAIGLYLPSKRCVQVSVNLCDFKKTGLMKLMTEIKKQAKILKIKIKNSEIIGLVPKKALFGVNPEFLCLKGAGKKGYRFYDVFRGKLYKWGLKK